MTVKKASRLLALKLKQSETRASIDTVKSPTKGLVSDPKEINAEFHSFYRDLYKSSIDFNANKCDNFLQGLELPSLDEQEAEELGWPMALQELENALKLTNKGKSPGPDGIPPEVLLRFWDLLGPVLLASILSAVEQGAFHEHTNVALISLIPKKGRDHTDCANYRPISLIDADKKLYSKVLAIRLEKHL